ncbi:MAG: thymidine phosphorylase [Elusimicrobia bacterium]|nr:thymidine phosphorylase [Elusimicrobiota bacterium]
MNTYEIIYKKREGKVLTKEEIGYIISGYLAGDIPDYQVSAFLMAIFFKGMETDELAEFTRLMADSGEKVDLSSMGAPTVDKHSTGGVGDGVSLILAPLAASLGAVVPMMSGRGLGHTGGTLDKLESIPGYNVNLSQEEFIRQLEKIGVAIIGQTENIAPADKEFYALRDVTATVDSIPLITASIMSKKLAEGVESLVLDVKTGSGAFMRRYDDAVSLAKAMIDTGRAHGRNMAAIISDMSQPLGRSVGNALEIKQAVEVLKGAGPADMRELTLELVSIMLQISGIEPDPSKAEKMTAENLSNGKALQKFAEMVEEQGGDPRVAENPDRVLPAASYSLEVKAPSDGYIEKMDTRLIGVAALSLGAGRRNMQEKIDFSAGIEVLAKTGDKVSEGEVIAVLYSSRESDLSGVADDYLAGLSFSEEEQKAPELIYRVLR